MNRDRMNAAQSYTDARRDARYQVTADSVLFGQNAEQGVSAVVENISDGGLMVQTYKPVDETENFLVMLLGDGAKDLVFSPARVVWQRQDKDGANHVGLQFTNQTPHMSQWITVQVVR